MAIEFNCPHCQSFYRLKDEFAGKKATCKNPDCRQIITIPAPALVPNDQHMPSAAELEAAALSALADEGPSNSEVSESSRVIPMTCSFCDHKWTEPFSKAGKNTLCPNPECRQRLKVPELKSDEIQDWRQSKTRLPSGAKQNFEKLEGVEDAAEAKIVSGTALREADATGIEIEPRSLKEKAIIGSVIFAIVFGIALSGWYLMRTRTTGQEDQLVLEARREFDANAKDLPELQAGLCSALLNIASAEYAVRQNTPDKLKEAQALLGKKTHEEQWKQLTGPERDAVAAELAFSVVSLGGSNEEVKEQIRYRWQPEIASGKLKIDERSQTIHKELRQMLGDLKSADFEFRTSTARTLTRTLCKKGQAGFAADIIPLAAFGDREIDEARAVVALEIFRLDRGSEVARTVAGELKSKIVEELNPKNPKGGIKGNPFPASAHTAIVAILSEKGFVPAPGKLGSIDSDAVRTAYVGISLLEGNEDEALKLALRDGKPESQLKALVLCAEWMASPNKAIEEALNLLERTKGKRDVSYSPYQLLRLSQIAASGGLTDQSKTLANAIGDEGLKVWAIGDAVHMRAVANPKEKIAEADMGLPEDPKKVRVGHAQGMLWIARRNAFASGDRSNEKKAVTSWPALVHPFGLAGIALGLQDR